MGFYGRHVLPRLIDLVGKERSATELRKQIIPAAEGSVLEVGIGSALNLPFYSPRVKHLYGLDTSPELLTMTGRKTAAVLFPVELLNQTAEKIPLPDESVDTVVTTWVLCSIRNAVAALKEMKRVLRVNGHLIFVEHGLSPDPRVQAWQNRITPIWRRVAGGCCINKKIDALIGGAGFTITSLHNTYLPGPRPMKYVYYGFARPFS